MSRRRSNIAYWIALVAALAFTVIVCLKRKTLAEGSSLEWLIGGAVFLAILIHELLDSLHPRSSTSSPPKTRQTEVVIPESPKAQSATASNSHSGHEHKLSGHLT